MDVVYRSMQFFARVSQRSKLTILIYDFYVFFFVHFFSYRKRKDNLTIVTQKKRPEGYPLISKYQYNTLVSFQNNI